MQRGGVLFLPTSSTAATIDGRFQTWEGIKISGTSLLRRGEGARCSFVFKSEIEEKGAGIGGRWRHRSREGSPLEVSDQEEEVFCCSWTCVGRQRRNWGKTTPGGGSSSLVGFWAEVASGDQARRRGRMTSP